MLKLIFSIITLIASSGVLLIVQRNWLTLAATERTLAETDRSLSASFSRVRPEVAAERLAKAEEHDRLAVRYTRRAWPFKDRSQGQRRRVWPGVLIAVTAGPAGAVVGCWLIMQGLT